MDNLSQHSYEELLNAYIDGELDPSLEEELFSQLSLNTELRETLRDMQAIRSATRNYASAFTPPAQLTQRVFSGLGMSTPSSIVTTAGGSMLGRIIPFLTKFWLPISTVVITGSVTGWLLLTPAAPPPPPDAKSPEQGAMRDPSPDAKKDLTNNAPKTAGSSSEATDLRMNMERTNNVPAASEGDPVLSSESAVSHTRIAERSMREEPRAPARDLRQAPPAGKDVTAEREADPGAAGSEAASNADPEQQVGPLEFVETPLVPLPESGTITGTPRKVGFGSLYGMPTLPAGISVSYRGFSTASFPAATIGAQANPLFNNMALGVSFRLGNGNEAGLEIGQEAFSQHFSGVEDGKHVRYEQNLLTPWLTAKFTHQFGELAIGGTIVPVASLQAGTTFELWPVVRGTLGAQYSPLPNLRFTLGVEGGLLFYPFQNAWFSSRTAGVTYGVSVGF